MNKNNTVVGGSPILKPNIEEEEEKRKMDKKIINYTTTTIYPKDLEFLKRIQKKEGYKSPRIIISKIINLIKLHKMEGEI